MQYLTRSAGPTSSQDSRMSRTLDYSGLEDHAKRIDLLPQMQSQKFAALYDGDIPGSVAAGQRIRSLIDSIKNPRQPLVRVAGESASSSAESRGPVMEGQPMQFPIENNGKAGGVAKGNPAAAPAAPMPVSRRPPPVGAGWQAYPLTQTQDDVLRMAGWDDNAPLQSRKPSSLDAVPYPITASDREAARNPLARLAGFGK